MNTVMAGIGALTAFALTLEGAVGRIERGLMVWQPRAARPRSCEPYDLPAKAAAERRPV